MKSNLFIAALALTVGIANAQTVKEDKVPAEVKSSLEKMYPGAKVQKWEMEAGMYEAEFDNNKLETSVLMDAKGNLIKSEVEMEVKDLPKAISEYAANELKGAKIKEGWKITTKDKKTNYGIEVNNEDYIFDDAGKFIKKESGKDKDDDDTK